MYKNVIFQLGVAIGCDHAGEQVNHKNKTGSELKGMTRNQNNRNLHYLAAPLQAQLQEEMMSKGIGVFFVLRLNNTSLVGLICSDQGRQY